MKIGVYPGSFDPVTNGHLDVIARGARLFDALIVAVAINESKHPLFTLDERLGLLGPEVEPFANVSVDTFEGLTVDFVQRLGGHAILRGIRSISDFEYEFQMALTNRVFAPEIETVFVMAHVEYSFISSRLIKEAAAAHGDISAFVPPRVGRALADKLGYRGALRQSAPVSPGSET